MPPRRSSTGLPAELAEVVHQMVPGDSPEEEQTAAKKTRPEFLASLTPWRQMMPVEPWARTLSGLMAVMGALLLVLIFVPYAIPAEDPIVFGWHAFGTFPDLNDKILLLLTMAAGMACVATSVVPISTRARAMVATLAGGLVATLAMRSGASFLVDQSSIVVSNVQVEGSYSGALIAAVGLLVRSRYPAALLGRVMATAGAAIIGIALVAPATGLMGLEHWDQDWPTAVWLVASIFFALAGLSVWLPASIRRGTVILAWMLLALLPLSLMAWATELGADRWDFIQTLGTTLFPAIQLTCCSVLFAYGGASLIGKLLENRGTASAEL